MTAPIHYPNPQDNPHCRCKNNPMGSFFCQYGHMMECHFPYSCADAACSHLMRYDLTLDHVERLTEIARKATELGKHQPYTFDVRGQIEVNPDLRSSLKKFKLARTVKGEVKSVEDLFGKNIGNEGETVYLLENTGTGMIVQNEDKTCSFFVQPEDLLLFEPANFVVFFEMESQMYHVFLEGITSMPAVPSLATELINHNSPYTFTQENIVVIREWYFPLEEAEPRKTDEVKGTYRVKRDIMTEYYNREPSEQELVVTAGQVVTEIERDGTTVMIQCLDGTVITIEEEDLEKIEPVSKPAGYHWQE